MALFTLGRSLLVCFLLVVNLIRENTKNGHKKIRVESKIHQKKNKLSNLL
jgi:hypothetical protein